MKNCAYTVCEPLLQVPACAVGFGELHKSQLATSANAAWTALVKSAELDILMRAASAPPVSRNCTVLSVVEDWPPLMLIWNPWRGVVGAAKTIGFMAPPPVAVYVIELGFGHDCPFVKPMV